MSDYESHTGKIKKVEPRENESFEQLCRRLWVDNGQEIEQYKDEGDLFGEFYEKYLNVNDESVWEIVDHEDNGDDEDSFCKLHDNKDGTFSFHTRFYNGGTCMSEMLEYELKKH